MLLPNLILTSFISLVLSHGSEHLPENGEATYAELHMASEHHMDSFDIQAFFHLHDLNRDGILDVNELESIYGVHHEKVKKGSESQEVHTEQAKEIVKTVLAALDTNGDGVLTMREFVAGGVGGLPNFKGIEHLGHHYDEEGEYFLHHEEQYHNTPETQREEDYVHPEDIAHFLSHQKIEDEEDQRTKEFLEVPHSNEQIPLLGTDGLPVPAVKPDGTSATSARIVDEAARVTRASKARAQAQQFGEEAEKRGEWGKEDFSRPKDDADRMRKAVPYKFRIRGNSWNRDL